MTDPVTAGRKIRSGSCGIDHAIIGAAALAAHGVARATTDLDLLDWLNLD